jgi:hypothetical protein
MPDKEIHAEDLSHGDNGQAWFTRIRSAMASLPNRERFILAERRLKDPPTPLEVLAAMYGVSKGRISQIEHQALGRLGTVARKAPRELSPSRQLRLPSAEDVWIANSAPTADDVAMYRSVVMTGYGPALEA